jgi:DNA-directed RNA polymerase subunit D
MELLNKQDDKIEFQAEINESLINAIRRYISFIPIAAIDEVEIYKNDSPLYDETIAHRLGLIPIKNKNIDVKKLPQLKLDVKREGFVYSKDLVGNAEVVFDKMPITFLKKNEELKLNAVLNIGRGKDHSKFSPGLIFYRNTFDIKIDKDCPKEIVNVCPKRVLKLKDGKIIAENKEKCDGCEVCIEECKKTGKDSIKINPSNKIIITVESFGQLDVKDILKKSIEELKKDLKEVSKKI